MRRPRTSSARCATCKGSIGTAAARASTKKSCGASRATILSSSTSAPGPPTSSTPSAAAASPSTGTFATSSHFFPHFSPSENEQILRESLRVARVGVAFTDTRRHIAPLFFTLLLRWFHLVGRITAFDAPASIRRGYTTAEARTIAERVAPAVVENYVPFRWAMFLRNAAVPAAGQAASRRPSRTRGTSEPAGADAGGTR